MDDPIINDHTIYRILRHAIYLAIVRIEATATFMFQSFPIIWEWIHDHQPLLTSLTACSHLGYEIGAIPANEIASTSPQSWILKRLLYPRPLKIFVS